MSATNFVPISTDCLVRNTDDGSSSTISQLEKRLSVMEERLFAAELRGSSSTDSGIPTGHTDAYHGGAFLDETRRQIISVTRDCNNSRDVFVTRLIDAEHGTTEKKPALIPFDSYTHEPIYDGDRFAYFTETAIEGRKGNRFGRLDLTTFTFAELTPFPLKYADACAGCYHHGIVYVVDNKSQLCGYDPEEGTWNQYGFEVPVETDARYGRLLSDPLDKDHLYLLGRLTMSNLYRIDLVSRSYCLLSKVPVEVYELDATLVRATPESKDFIIVASMRNCSWYMYSSKTNSWKALPEWKKVAATSIHNYLVYSTTTKTFYYHVHGCSTWETVQL